VVLTPGVGLVGGGVGAGGGFWAKPRSEQPKTSAATAAKRQIKNGCLFDRYIKFLGFI
jgi:hypothetical protein